MNSKTGRLSANSVKPAASGKKWAPVSRVKYDTSSANDYAMLDALNNKTIQLGAWGATSTRTYDIKVEFLDAGPGGADNNFQGSSSAIDLGWELTS